jgi:hypothetical protein
VGLEARGSIESGGLELVLNWRNYFEEIAFHRICAYPFSCRDEFEAWRKDQAKREAALPSALKGLV